MFVIYNFSKSIQSWSARLPAVVYMTNIAVNTQFFKAAIQGFSAQFQ